MRKSVVGVFVLSLCVLSSLSLVSAASDSPGFFCKLLGWGCPEPQLAPGNLTKARAACSPNLPDLVISSLNTRVYSEYDPEQNRTYNYVELTGVLSNVGCAPTNRTSYDFGVVGVGGGSTAYPAPIAAGQSIAIGPVSMGGPILEPGPHVAFAIADRWNEILESNENNNNKTTNFTV